MTNPCGANISLAARKITYLSTLGAMCSVVLINFSPGTYSTSYFYQDSGNTYSHRCTLVY